MSKKPSAPVRYVLHVFNKKTNRLQDTVFDTVKARDAAWWKYTQRHKGASVYRTQTRRTA